MKEKNSTSLNPKTILSKDGYLLNKKLFDASELNKIKNELTVEPQKFGVSYGKKKEEDNLSFKVFRETDDYLIIPKYYGLDKFSKPEQNKEIKGEDVDLIFKGGLRGPQLAITEKVIPLLEKTDGGLISLGCGGGKCLGKNTPILMYDGTIKMVQDINRGEIIMGNDSKPRNILSIARGKEMTYKICEDKKNGESYIVNESHILSLKNKNGEIIDICVRDFIRNYSQNLKKLKGFRVPIIFSEKETEINPYLFGKRIKESENIPYNYKCNSPNNQLELLKGIIQAFGKKQNKKYKISVFNPKLLEDIIFLSRSLGFSVFKSSKFSILIDNFLPNLTYKIKIEKLEVDDYYGFEIDGNRRFVLGDLSVTHNTVLSLYIAAHFKVKTLVIVHKSFLLNQWKERIEQFTNANVGIIQRDKVDTDGKQIVIGMIQSIAKEKYDVDIFRDFGLVIFDEAHHAPSKYFSRALPLIACKKTLALSATPKRSDKLEKVLYWYLGPIIFKNEQEENTTVLAKIYKYKIEHEKFVEKKIRYSGEVNRPGTITNLITIGRRNRFIIDLTEDILNEENRKIIILSERKEHLELLKKRLDEREITTTGLYVGGMKQNKLDESAKCSVIFGTYQMASEALDIKGLNTLVMASPRREIEQTIGRITRDPESKVRPLVIDITDDLDSFVRQSYARRKYYRNNGFQIKYHEVEDNEIKFEEDITQVKENKLPEKINPTAIDFID